MFLAHSIRLRDPWKCEESAGGDVRWTRRFNRPTGLEPDDLVWLMIGGLPEDAAVHVNGAPVPGATGVSPVHGALEDPTCDTPVPPRQFDLTPVLAESNRIEILLKPQASSLKPHSFPFDVRLAIIGQS